MSYFTEIEGYETYAGKVEDFHFIYNANSGGGQSFLGGKFRDASGNLVSPVSLDGRIGVFHFKSEDKSGVHDILLEDSSASYEIKPRATGDRNMKFSVGREKKPPSYTIAAFLMLPEPCGVEKSVSLDTSVLNSNNYWLQSMWLSVDTVTEDKAVLSVRDCVFGGGVDGDGHGDARYFSFDFNKRIADIITIAQNADLESEVSSCIKYFADIYTGQKPFVYNEARTAINSVMKYLSVKYPEEYSGTLDPMVMIRELAQIKNIATMKADARPDILAAIRTKPFILLAGISGTGKTRIVRQLARGCCHEPKLISKETNTCGNYECIPVRPNWHDSTELLGYVTRITKNNEPPKYIVTPFVEFLAKAWTYRETPFFLCLDEMNLAPVEQYFAEYLSVVESREKITVGDGADTFECLSSREKLVRFDSLEKETKDGLLKELFENKDWAKSAEHGRVQQVKEMFEKDQGIRLPPNLVVMGTVNMDETTCTFSRKVLDRAMSFELNDVSDMYAPANLAGEGDCEFGSIDADAAKGTLLTGKEAYDSAGGQRVAVAADNTKVGDAILAFLENLNEKEMPAKKADGSDGEGNMSLLAKTPFKIAYRSRNEIMIYCIERIAGNIVPLPQALDEALSMKVLSRIEGDSQHVRPEWLQTLSAAIVDGLSKLDGYDADKCVVCKDKLADMVEQAQYGYTSFWMR